MNEYYQNSFNDNNMYLFMAFIQALLVVEMMMAVMITKKRQKKKKENDLKLFVRLKIGERKNTEKWKKNGKKCDKKSEIR